MRKLIKNLFTSSLILALCFSTAAGPAGAAAPGLRHAATGDGIGCVPGP